MGLAVGVLAAIVDVVDTAVSGFRGSTPLLALYALSALTLCGGLLGAVLAGFSILCRHLTRRIPGKLGTALHSFCLGAPGGIFCAWVPTSWIRENAETLSPSGMAIAIAVYPLAFVLSTTLAWLGLFVVSRYENQTPALPRFHFPLLVLSGLLAAGCYVADRTVLVGLYDDFHRGLTGAFLSASTLFVALTWKTSNWWMSRRPVPVHEDAKPTLVQRTGFPATALEPGWVTLGGAALLLSILEVARPDVFGPSVSVVFGKLSVIVRDVTDWDRDGSSSYFGGSDCAPFDPEVRPGAFDMPGDDRDEDCSGTAAQWPSAEPKGGYTVPDAKGFNVLLVTVDALRADHVGAWGYDKNPTSPNLDRLALESVRFKRAFASAPKTYDTLPSLVTGLYPTNVPRDYRLARTKGRKPKPYLFRITDEVELLPETLRRQGYDTGAGHGVSVLQTLGLNRGFRRYKATHKLVEFTEAFFDEHESERANDPFFLWLHFYSPHASYEKWPEFDFGDSDLNRYDSEIAHDDHDIGRVFDMVRQRGEWERTIVVVTADHGEEFGEHGGTGHGFKLYSELTHVPLLVRIPGVPAQDVFDPVELADVTPTLCELLKIDTACAKHDGHSLLAAIAGVRPKERGAYSELYRKGDVLRMSSLYTGEWRIVYDYIKDRAELYDVRTDPGEQTNVSKKHPELVKKLVDRMTMRNLYRQGVAFQEYQETGNTLELAEHLPLFRRRKMLDLVLEQFENNPHPGLRPHLKKLSKRPGLDAKRKGRVNALLRDVSKGANESGSEPRDAEPRRKGKRKNTKR